ncbi:unnamed protein product [Closterium sp. NIES-54]
MAGSEGAAKALHDKSVGLKLGDRFPDFEADTSTGRIKWHEYIEGSWAILFSHPADFTPVCTTELGSVAKFAEDFAKKGVKVAALSCDSAESHRAWISDIEAFTPGVKVTYPIIADPSRDIAVKLGMLDAVAKDAAGLPLTARAVFVLGPDKTLKLAILYPATTGRNFHEILRVIDSLQLTAKYSVATPVDWKHGDDVIVAPSVSNEAAKDKFPKGFKTVDLPSGKSYLRTTPQLNFHELNVPRSLNENRKLLGSIRAKSQGATDPKRYRRADATPWQRPDVIKRRPQRAIKGRAGRDQRCLEESSSQLRLEWRRSDLEWWRVEAPCERVERKRRAEGAERADDEAQL